MTINTQHTIINGDSRSMKELENNSIDLIVTSPPYWQLKDYGSKDQIGYHDDYQSYINNLNLIWQECYRVLNSGCRCCINIGDQFARSAYYGRYKVVPIRTEIIKFCEAICFDYMGAIIWQKKTTSNTTGGASLMGSYPYPKNGIISIDYEFILIFKKLGLTKKPNPELKELSKMTKAEWKEYFSGHWNFSGAKQEEHLAMFPEELPKRLIKMFSYVGDIVLDPFLGSGTTSLAARNLFRNSVGYEINSDFLPLIKKKLDIEQKTFSEYIFKIQQRSEHNYDKATELLPYKFIDYHKLDKKIDPKQLQFGSKIDKTEIIQKEDFFTVKEIISSELVKLNNDSVVRLLGVQESKELKEKAVEFLKQKTQGQRVFLKFDAIKFDENNRHLVYLYLKNRTFINAHLIKYGFAEVDTFFEYKYKEKFILIRKQKWRKIES